MHLEHTSLGNVQVRQRLMAVDDGFRLPRGAAGEHDVRAVARHDTCDRRFGCRTGPVQQGDSRGDIEPYDPVDGHVIGEDHAHVRLLKHRLQAFGGARDVRQQEGAARLGNRQ
ncbi:hypothetical protein WKI71_44750 [Streptomyces sp. MS1.AVA.1]|uniref:Uncharacterized protein n=1 Tax=Streptomyces machairae TaxID=3134109 RepID=A0ABU8UVH8_9ACTN